MAIRVPTSHSGARLGANPESTGEHGMQVWIPDRRFAASGMTARS